MITPNKLPESTVKYLSERLKDEQMANRFYRYVSNCLRNSGYMIASKYFASEASDEIEHAKGLEVYAADWNVELDFLELPAVGEYEGIVEIVEAAYKLEWDLLQAYKNNLFIAQTEEDYSTFNLLQKYVQIQTESVAEYATLLNQLSLFDSKDKNQVFLFEKKLFKI